MPPRLPEPMVSRPRLARHLGALIDQAPIVSVCASAGSGKTTAVLEAVMAGSRPTAWLTVDGSDTAAGRLVTYLEAALSGIVPAAEGIGTRALAAQVPHVEAAGLLADAVGSAPSLLVLDELERLAGSPQALAVISAVLRFAPPELRVVLISREDLELDAGSTDRLSRIVAVGESELAFTIDEAAAALQQRGDHDVDPTAAVEATGGWVTGVLFEAWRSESHRFGAGGEADPLHGYLASQILSRLTAAERELLITTAPLEEVTAEGAAALGEPHAADVLTSLRHHRLPGSWDADGGRFRAHRRFREYLGQCLMRRPERDIQRLRVAHGRLLADAGRDEEATEQFLAGGALADAADAAERAVYDVIRRGDFDVAERWIRLLGEATVGRSRALTAAELMTTNAREDYGRGQVVADRLVALYQEAGEPLPGAMYGLVGWCYFLVGRLADDDAVRRISRPSPETDLLAHTSALETGRAGVAYADTPASFGSDFDVILRRVHLSHGRLDRALEPGSRPWQQAVNKPWQIEALTASGRLDEALALHEEAKKHGWSSSYLDGHVAVELLAAAGRHEEAFEALVSSRETVLRSGSTFYEMLHLLAEAKLTLRINGDTASARALLARVRRLPGASELLRTRSLVLIWDGMRLLLDNDDEAARDALRAAVDLLSSHDRLLDLPTAAVYLAEAEWRCGEEEAADAAADLALTTSRSTGTNQRLLQALRDFPAVAARRIDAEPRADSPWHAIGRALADRGVMVAATAPVRVRDLGELRVEVGDQLVAPRLRKSLELLAYLARTPAAGRAGREELLDALFEHRDSESARSYLRQALTRLRNALPEGTVTREADGSIVLAPGTVASDAALLEGRIKATYGLSDPERRLALERAFEDGADAVYLADVDAPWVQERRAELLSVLCQAHIDVAQLAFDAGDYADAKRHADEALTADPFRESAWRLLMRIRSVLGDDDGVVTTFRSCVTALEDAGLTPADATRALLSSLRR